MMSVPSLIPPPTSTHSKINPNKPPIQHTSFLKKQPAFCFLTSALYHSNCSKMIKLLIFLLKTNPDRISGLFFRILFLHLLIGVCLIINTVLLDFYTVSAGCSTSSMMSGLVHHTNVVVQVVPDCLQALQRQS